MSRLRATACLVLGWLALAVPGLAQEPVEPTGSGEGTGAAEPSPDDLVDWALDTSILGFQTGDTRLSMVLHAGDGSTRQRSLHTRSLEVDGHTRALVRVLAPPDMAGQSYLFMQNEGRDSDIWIYLPALEDEPRRITGSQRNQSFLGTNITYADLEGRQFDEGDNTRLPDEEIAGFPVFVVQNVNPDSAYSRLVFYIRKSDYVPLRVRFYGDDGEVLKTLFSEEVAERQGRTYVRRMSIADADGTGTTVVVDEVDFEADVSVAELTRENLTR